MSFRKFVSSVFSSGLVVAPALTTAYFAFVNGDVEVLDSTSRVPVLQERGPEKGIQEPQEITPTPAPPPPVPAASSSSSSEPSSPDSGSGQSSELKESEDAAGSQQADGEEQTEAEEKSESDSSDSKKTPSLLPKTVDPKPKIQFAGWDVLVSSALKNGKQIIDNAFRLIPKK